MYKFKRKGAQLYIPDGATPETAFERTTHVGVGAHPDDIEIGGYPAVLECFKDPVKWLFGTLIVTEGGGSPGKRDVDYSYEDTKSIRMREQKEAADIGKYSGVVFLSSHSNIVKNRKRSEGIIEDLKYLINVCRPSAIYTHALTDRDNTHMAVALRTIEALRELPKKARPSRLYGCEVWGSLDWLVDKDKITFDVSGYDKLAKSLLNVFKSQKAVGKEYEIAVIGRRKANATFFDPHKPQEASDFIFGMDMTRLIRDTGLDPETFVSGLIDSFKEDVLKRIRKIK